MNRKVVRGYLWSIVLESVARGWFGSTYQLFLTASGLTPWQMNLVNTIFMTISAVFDPFTGNLADRIGQKKVFLGGMAFWGIGTLVYGFSHTFWYFALAEGISAIGHALISEALESWMVNHIGAQEAKISMSNTGTYSRLAMIPTALLGGWIGSHFGWQWPWFFSAASTFAAIPTIWWLLKDIPERPTGYQVREIPNTFSLIKKTFTHKELRFVAIVFLVTSACVQPFNMFWPLIFQKTSGQNNWGGVWIGVAITSAIGAWLAKRWPSSRFGIATSMLLIGVPMVFPALLSNVYPILLFFFSHEAGRDLSRLVLFNYANKHIDDYTRSTMNSVRSSLGTVGAALGLLVFGWLTNFVSPVQTWSISAVALILTALLVWQFG